MQSGVTLIGVLRNINRIEVPVTSAWGSDGAAVNDSTDSTAVTLCNIGDFPIEYRVDSGPWTRLELRNLLRMELSLASATIQLRRSEFGGDGLAQVEIESLGNTFSADGHAVNLGGGGPGGGAESFTDLSDAPDTITPNAVMTGNTAGDGLQMSDVLTIDDTGSLNITTGGGGGVFVAVSDDGGIGLTDLGDGGIVIQSNSGGGVNIRAGGDNGVIINGNGAGGVQISSLGDGAAGVHIIVSGGAPLKVNSETAVATQEVVVAGVGTLVFTHGLLTGFTPA